MSSPTDQSEQPGTILPPELSPLTNPVLARNMGRWAEVYFTNPPEKREQAVLELLRELEAGDLPTRGAQPDSSLNEDGPEVLAILHEARREPLLAARNWERHESSDDSDLAREWASAWERHRFFIGALIGIAFLAVVFVLIRSVHSSLQGIRANNQAPTEVAAPAQNPTTGEAPPRSAAAPSSSQVKPVASRPAPSATKPAISAAPPKRKPVPAGPGSEELVTAQSFLNGTDGHQRDSGAAATWLWKAVAKRNPDATLLLADLYLKGDGVAKSCDQARVLLDAAARKGKTGAADRLRHLQAFGCE